MYVYTYVYTCMHIYACIINENQYNADACLWVKLKKFIDVVEEEQSKYPLTQSFMFRFIDSALITFIQSLQS